MRAVNEETGRVNQKLRTRIAIVEACREVIRSGGPVTMPAVACAALVSEPTAYRYFPDLTSLLNAALVGMWPSPAEALEPVAASADPVNGSRSPVSPFCGGWASGLAGRFML